MKKPIQIVLIIILALSPWTACRPIKQPNSLRINNLPDTYSLSKQGPEYTDKWWQTFNSEELNNLVEKALTDNFSIQEAWCRLRQVRTQAVKAGAGLYPDVSLTIEASKSRQKSDNAVPQNVTTTTLEHYGIGLAGNYELDFWGKIHSEQQAAELESRATRQDVNTAAITIAAQVTEHWIQIISQKAQQNLFQEQLKTNQIFLDLVRLRFQKSLASALDVFQQEQTIEKVKAAIPLIEAREQILLHELALLLGRAPGTIHELVDHKLPELQEVPAIGLPADLLIKRPDIRAAGLRVFASERQLAAAKADRLPAIRLTAQARYGANELKNIFDQWLLNLAANVTTPFFNAHRLKAEVERSQAATDQKLIAYRKITLTAIKEVENALIQEAKHHQHIKALQSQLTLTKQALEKARQRYIKGLIDYLPVLTELIKVQNLQGDLIQRRTELLVYRIILYRALGGSWMNEL